VNLERLRADTRAEHEATEQVMPVMDPGLTMEQYVGVLHRLELIVRSWEQWAQAHVPEDLAAIMDGRQRAELLRLDLQWAGAAPGIERLEFCAGDFPDLQEGAPNFHSAFLGAMYVMEGSTLGGQYIARHLEETLALGPGEGDAYFRGYGERTGEMWRAFKAVLAEVPEQDSDAVIAAANAMFRWFRVRMAE
jgi:heme oxygenase